MFQRPVQYVTTTSILDLGVDTVQGDVYTSDILPVVEYNENIDDTTGQPPIDNGDVYILGPVHMGDDQGRDGNQMKEEGRRSREIIPTPPKQTENDSNELRFRGDHILWIQ